MARYSRKLAHVSALPQPQHSVGLSSPHSVSATPSIPLSMTVRTAVADTLKRALSPHPGHRTPAKQFVFTSPMLLRGGAA